MKDKNFPTDKSILDCVRVNYEIEVKTIEPLAGGADRNAAIYKIQTQSQSTYFLKLKYGYENDINITLLELLYSRGIKQIIPPIRTIQGNSILQLGNWALILYPFIEGVNGFTHKLTDEQWILLGKTLRQVHDLDVPSSLLKYIRQETYSPKWRQSVRSLFNLIEKVQTGRDVLSQKFSNFMKEHRLIIQRLIDRAEALSLIISKQPTKFVLCHSDIHGGNVLIKGNDALYIVDWDDPIMAPKERDLMFIGGGVANVWNNPEEEASFYEGYGNTDINPSILAYYRHERIVEDIAEFGEALLIDNAQKNREEMYKHFVDMFDPHGVVDIAFKTDKMV